MNFFKRLFSKPTNPASTIPTQKNVPPVMLRPWGGNDATQLMIELNPDAFKGAQVGVAIEKGYVDTGEYEPQQWVEHNCSGLKYIDHHQANGTLFITMEIDPSLIKPSSEYHYLISGDGGGEYSVGVFKLVKGKEPECLFDRCFCCK